MEVIRAVVGALALLLVAAARAMPAPSEVLECATWAQMVEAIAGMDEVSRAQLPANIRRYSDDPQHTRMVLLAYNFVEQGGLAGDRSAYTQALALCGGEDA